MAASGDIEVTLVDASSPDTLPESLRLPDGATLERALRASALVRRIDPLGQRRVGIFGHLCLPTQVLAAGDRIEIYQPVRVDPKEARRRRAAVKSRRKG